MFCFSLWVQKLKLPLGFGLITKRCKGFKSTTDCCAWFFFSRISRQLPPIGLYINPLESCLALVWRWFKMSWALCFSLAQLWISCCLKWVLHPPQRVLNLEAAGWFLFWQCAKEKKSLRATPSIPDCWEPGTALLHAQHKAHFTHLALLCYCWGSEQPCRVACHPQHRGKGGNAPAQGCNGKDQWADPTGQSWQCQREENARTSLTEGLSSRGLILFY